MKQLILFIALSSFAMSALFGQKEKDVKPKLVVGIVVDQMRFDHLYIYQDRYSDNGLNRILREGYNFKNSHCDYIPTVTAAGHASIYTGTTPSGHGIIGNGWFDRQFGEDVSNVEDSTVSVIGSKETNNKGASPKKILVNTISDQIRLSNHFKSKVISVSLKDRGAILPGGHTANGAYWHDWRSSPGYFVTSSYYMDEVPEWVAEFNHQELSSKYLDTIWNTLYPIDTYTSSIADSNKYERALRGKTGPVFPYDFKEMRKVYRELNAEYQLIWASPAGNTIVTDFAMAAIANEKLGADEFPDLLNISYSVTDAAGHAFGPQAVEMEDIYLRLDMEIENLLNYLDENVGKGAYTLFLTSDHGAIENVSYLHDNNLPSGIARINEYKEKLDAYLSEKYGNHAWVQQFDGKRIYLDRDTIRDHAYELVAMQEDIAAFMMTLEGVTYAATANNLETIEYNKGHRELLQNGHHPGRSGDVLLVFNPGYIQTGNPDLALSAVKGTTHGSGYSYDTQVPILWYGAGVKQGESVRRVSVTDISPTVAMMLNLQLPNGNTGEPMKELFE